MTEYKRKPNTVCSVCNTAVYRRPYQIELNHGHVFCSSTCYGLSTRKEHACVVCGTSILSGANKKTCSRSCANTNRVGTIYKTGSRKDKVKYQRGLKMRLLAERGPQCERCTYDLVEILHVHHKDRDRMHNDLVNLELICPNCHAKEHYLENSWFSGRI